eukprot:1156171-Rhodomonas_salina.2
MEEVEKVHEEVVFDNLHFTAYQVAASYLPSHLLWHVRACAATRPRPSAAPSSAPSRTSTVSYTHLRAHETEADL